MSNLKINLEVDLEDFISLEDLEDNIIRQLCDRAQSYVTAGHGEAFHIMAKTAIENAVADKLKEVVEEKLSKPIPRIDRFGEAVDGEEPKSLNDMIAESADAALEQTVDPNSGKPKKNTNYDRAVPRLQYLIGTVAAAGVSREAERVAREVNKQAKENVNKVLANAVATQLARMAK